MCQRSSPHADHRRPPLLAGVPGGLLFGAGSPVSSRRRPASASRWSRRRRLDLLTIIRGLFLFSVPRTSGADDRPFPTRSRRAHPGCSASTSLRSSSPCHRRLPRSWRDQVFSGRRCWAGIRSRLRRPRRGRAEGISATTRCDSRTRSPAWWRRWPASWCRPSRRWPTWLRRWSSRLSVALCRLESGFGVVAVACSSRAGARQASPSAAGGAKCRVSLLILARPYARPASSANDHPQGLRGADRHVEVGFLIRGRRAADVPGARPACRWPCTPVAGPAHVLAIYGISCRNGRDVGYLAR